MCELLSELLIFDAFEVYAKGSTLKVK